MPFKPKRHKHNLRESLADYFPLCPSCFVLYGSAVEPPDPAILPLFKRPTGTLSTGWVILTAESFPYSTGSKSLPHTVCRQSVEAFSVLTYAYGFQTFRCTKACAGCTGKHWKSFWKAENFNCLRGSAPSDLWRGPWRDSTENVALLAIWNPWFSPAGSEDADTNNSVSVKVSQWVRLTGKKAPAWADCDEAQPHVALCSQRVQHRHLLVVLEPTENLSKDVMTRAPELKLNHDLISTFIEWRQLESSSHSGCCFSASPSYERWTHPADQTRPELTEILEVKASNPGVQLASDEKVIQGVS